MEPPMTSALQTPETQQEQPMSSSLSQPTNPIEKKDAPQPPTAKFLEVWNWTRKQRRDHAEKRIEELWNDPKYIEEYPSEADRSIRTVRDYHYELSIGMTDEEDWKCTKRRLDEAWEYFENFGAATEELEKKLGRELTKDEIHEVGRNFDEIFYNK
jgi:hypothetical protein